MTPVHPRQVVHSGHVQASGVVLHVEHIGEAEARRRVLGFWTAGASLTPIGSEWHLRWPRPRLLPARSGPGTLIVAAGPIQTAAPLSERERNALLPEPGSLVLVRGGEAQAIEKPSASIDPSEWFDVSAFRLVTVKTLALPPPPPLTIPVVKPIDARARLVPGLGEPPPERAVVMKSIEQEASAAGQGGRASDAAMQGAYKMGGFLTRLFAPLLRFIASREARQAQQTGGSTALAKPGLFDKAQDWMMRKLLQSPLGQLLASRQAQYLSRMLEMFDQGQLDEALRHAIPLGRGDDGGPSKPALGMPAPRPDLQISHNRGPSSSILLGGENLQALLRAKYRAAFEKLERAGRIEEAAFVLVELLRDYDEAIAFLEKHGKLELAAEIAESRQMAPALIVRLLFLAGNKQRAIDIARKHGAFQEAITRLERSNKGAAVALRLEWADLLATSGRLRAAVDAIRPVTTDASSSDGVKASAHRIMLEWIERGVAQGGLSSGPLLAYQLVLEPGKFETNRTRTVELLEGASQLHQLEFAQTLTAMLRDHGIPAEQKKGARVLSRHVVRSLLAKPVLLRPQGRVLVNELDGVLRADIPMSIPAASSPLTQQTPPLECSWEAHDTGRTPIYDAAMLPNGRMLVALGETGVRLLTSDGRVVAHFDRPAHALVVSDEGDRAIAIARRGSLCVLSKIQLHERTIRPWTEVELTAWADTYDGAVWYASTKNRLHAIDTMSEQWRALWSSANVEASVQVVRYADREVRWLAIETNVAEVWCFSQPDMTVRARRQTPDGYMQWGLFIDNGEAGLAFVGNGAVPRPPAPGLRFVPALSESEGVLAYRCAHQWRAALVVSAQGLRVELLFADVVRLQAQLGEGQRGAMRLDGEGLLVADDKGRLLVFDLNTGALTRDLRV